MTTTEAGATAPSGNTETAQEIQDIPDIQETRETQEPQEPQKAEAVQEVVTDHDRGVHGYHKQKDEHLKRLRRIEGQVRGLQRMVDEDVYCIDILTQVSASTKALQSFALQLLEEHLRHCVADAALKGGDEIDAKVEEATKAIGRLLRT
ncbi:metal-sensitive transcriptional regulator [Streptomyces sp. NBC_01136]|uniref:metal-sensitive transcriptional regulator n=1 Tax=unclassified Streptomyces TaxID=2593676 RepID=UPI00325400D3|nr:metal-sensitive transcriptional regulator [Streptomyces sp. NBC_01136]